MTIQPNSLSVAVADIASQGKKMASTKW